MESREVVRIHIMQADDDASFSLVAIQYYVCRGDNPLHPRFEPRHCFPTKSTQYEVLGVFLRAQLFSISSARYNTLLQNFATPIHVGAKHMRHLRVYNVDVLSETDPGSYRLRP
jgi:hypothetical protein